jgi:transcriptional regulator with XRE-family HTH domain
MIITEAIRHARRQRGLSQRRLAELAGLPQSTVARIETGHMSPRASTVGRLLAVLGFEWQIEPRLGHGVDRSLIRRMLSLTPQQRVEYSVAGGRAAAKLRESASAGNDL